MLIRIVRLSFAPELVPTFLSNFEENKAAIRASDGCKRLELLRDKHLENVYYTYSWWTAEEALNAYRASELFKNVWSNTKILFNDKPQAWSVEQVEVLD